MFVFYDNFEIFLFSFKIKYKTGTPHLNLPTEVVKWESSKEGPQIYVLYERNYSKSDTIKTLDLEFLLFLHQ